MMGLREKVALLLLTLVCVQLACRHCMPRKCSSHNYLNNLRNAKTNQCATQSAPLKANRKPTKYTNTRTAKATPNKDGETYMFKTYNFPETDFPLDPDFRGPHYYGIKNEYLPEPTEYNKHNSQADALLSNLRKERKIKRKLNQHRNSGNSKVKKETKPDTQPYCFSDAGAFPEVQYPINAMETWTPNYWNPLPFQDKEQTFDAFDFTLLNMNENTKVRTSRTQTSKYKKNNPQISKIEFAKTKPNKTIHFGMSGKTSNTTESSICENLSENTTDTGKVLIETINSSNTTLTSKQLTDIYDTLDSVELINFTNKFSPDNSPLTDTGTNSANASLLEISCLNVSEPYQIPIQSIDICPELNSNPNNSNSTYINATTNPGVLQEMDIPKPQLNYNFDIHNNETQKLYNEIHLGHMNGNSLKHSCEDTGPLLIKFPLPLAKTIPDENISENHNQILQISKKDSTNPPGFNFATNIALDSKELSNSNESTSLLGFSDTLTNSLLPGNTSLSAIHVNRNSINANTIADELIPITPTPQEYLIHGSSSTNIPPEEIQQRKSETIPNIDSTVIANDISNKNVIKTQVPPILTISSTPTNIEVTVHHYHHILNDNGASVSQSTPNHGSINTSSSILDNSIKSQLMPTTTLTSISHCNDTLDDLKLLNSIQMIPNIEKTCTEPSEDQLSQSLVQNIEISGTNYTNENLHITQQPNSRISSDNLLYENRSNTETHEMIKLNPTFTDTQKSNINMFSIPTPQKITSSRLEQSTDIYTTSVPPATSVINHNTSQTDELQPRIQVVPTTDQNVSCLDPLILTQTGLQIHSLFKDNLVIQPGYVIPSLVETPYSISPEHDLNIPSNISSMNHVFTEGRNELQKSTKSSVDSLDFDDFLLSQLSNRENTFPESRSIKKPDVISKPQAIQPFFHKSDSDLLISPFDTFENTSSSELARRNAPSNMHRLGEMVKQFNSPSCLLTDDKPGTKTEVITPQAFYEREENPKHISSFKFESLVPEFALTDNLQQFNDNLDKNDKRFNSSQLIITTDDTASTNNLSSSRIFLPSKFLSDKLLSPNMQEESHCELIDSQQSVTPTHDEFRVDTLLETTSFYSLSNSSTDNVTNPINYIKETTVELVESSQSGTSRLDFLLYNTSTERIIIDNNQNYHTAENNDFSHSVTSNNNTFHNISSALAKLSRSASNITFTEDIYHLNNESADNFSLNDTVHNFLTFEEISNTFSETNNNSIFNNLTCIINDEEVSKEVIETVVDMPEADDLIDRIVVCNANSHLPESTDEIHSKLTFYNSPIQLSPTESITKISPSTTYSSAKGENTLPDIPVNTTHADLMSQLIISIEDLLLTKKNVTNRSVDDLQLSPYNITSVTPNELTDTEDQPHINTTFHGDSNNDLILPKTILKTDGQITFNPAGTFPDKIITKVETENTLSTNHFDIPIEEFPATQRSIIAKPTFLDTSDDSFALPKYVLNIDITPTDSSTDTLPITIPLTDSCDDLYLLDDIIIDPCKDGLVSSTDSSSDILPITIPLTDSCDDLYLLDDIIIDPCKDGLVSSTDCSSDTLPITIPLTDSCDDLYLLDDIKIDPYKDGLVFPADDFFNDVSNPDLSLSTSPDITENIFTQIQYDDKLLPYATPEN